MLSIIGLITTAIVVILLMGKRFSPIIALTIIPFLAAIVAGFEMSEIANFYESGITKVMGVAVMFIFAILYFGIMQDVGLFTPLIRKMLQITGSNPVAITCGTVIIAAIAHVDGSGASTFLITIPALLPLYKKMKMNPYLLLLLVGTSASIVNMIPWGGPMGRSAIILEVDPTDLWRPLIPLQFVALLLLLALAFFLGLKEKKRIHKLEENIDTEHDDFNQDQLEEKEDHPTVKPIWVNLLLTLAVIAMLFWGIIPAGFTFMIGVGLALVLNFPQKKLQMNRLKHHAPNALVMATIILAAGSFLGILNGSGMLDSIATDMVNVLPEAIIPELHLIVGALGVPLELVLSTDATYFALYPIIEQIVTGYGVDATVAIYLMMIGNIIGTFISPFSPALWLALGLSGLEIGKHIRYSFLWIWGFSLALIAAAFLIGIV
ncbi:CitMHS family transporter [Mesonia mobilis]|uniref:CitMHS family transporter n=3 Tax=Mesonia mobilis TaxID=369791 RepID=UPI0026EE8D80|nr:citrate:proton symporter [Mesonia mobilis]